MRRLFLLNQLISQDKLTSQREEFLLNEVDSDDLKESLPPSDSLRRAYRKSYVAVEDNDLTLMEQQKILLWYLQQLKEPTLLQRIQGLLSFERGSF